MPHGRHLPAIDGETQLTAHYELRRRLPPELKERHGDYPLSAVVHHGIDVDVARLYFHDLNVLAVRPNTSLGLSMDSADPLMKVVSDVERRVAFVNGRVERMARQLLKSSPKVITMQSLRQMVVNVAKGIAGIQYGSRPVPVEGIDLADVTEVAVSWFNAFFDSFSAEVADREQYLIGAAPLLAGVAALGNTILASPDYRRAALEAELLESLRTVDWRKGEHWAGVAGRFSPKGVFTVSGTKEVGYGVFNALADPMNPNYRTVRHQAPGEFAAPLDPGQRDYPVPDGSLSSLVR